MGDFAFTCSGLIQLIKIMSLPRRSHTYLPGEVGNKAQTESLILKIHLFKIVHFYKCIEVAKECFFPSTCTPLKPYCKEIILVGHAV